MVRLKTRETVPHIVERYGEALKPLNISLDDGGLEYFIAGQSEIAADDYFKGERRIPVGMALGANYATKRWPLWTELASLIDPAHYVPVLLGGPMDVDAADAFVRRFPTAINAVGRCNLNVSAALVKRCRVIVTPDTGLMHIAAALGTPIVSLWGNTVPAFGMYPYRARFVALENALPCRPCSKLGFAACPRQHFHCMTLTRPESVWNAALKVMAQESA
jgi:ADP-heptose:LPS heptosyltransferase